MTFICFILQTLGTAACPPYHLAVVIGGTSAEFNLKTVKLASARYLDNLPTEGLYNQDFLFNCCMVLSSGMKSG